MQERFLQGAGEIERLRRLVEQHALNPEDRTLRAERGQRVGADLTGDKGGRKFNLGTWAHFETDKSQDEFGIYE